MDGSEGAVRFRRMGPLIFSSVSRWIQRSDQFSLFLLIGLVSGVMVCFTWRTYESFNTPKEAVLKIGTLLLGTVVFWGWVRRRRVGLPWGPMVWAVVALWGWGWVSLLVSPYRLQVVRSQAFSFHLLLVAVLVPLLLKGGKEIVRLWSGVAMLGGAVALIAVAQYFGFNYTQGLRLIPLTQPLVKTEIYSTIGNPNYVAAVLAFLLPIIVVLAVSGGFARQFVWGRMWTLALWGCAGVAAVALLLSRSKGGFVAGISGFVVLWLLWGRWMSWPLKRMLMIGIKYGGIGLLLFLMIGWLLPDVFPGRRLEGAALAQEWEKLSRLSWEDPSVKGRLLIWQTAREMIAAHPIIGIGTGTFGAQYQPYRALVFEKLQDPASTYPASEPSYNEAGQAHNDYLQLAAENGLVGLGLFVGLVCLCFFYGWRLLRKCSSPLLFTPYPFPLLCGVLAGMAALLTHAAVDFPLNQPVAALLFWLAIGTVLAMDLQRSVMLPSPFTLYPVPFTLHPAFSHRLIEWWPRWLLSGGVRRTIGTVAFLAVGWLMVGAIRPVVAEAYHRDAWLFMDRHQWAEAMAVIEKGLQWDPSHPELVLYRGVTAYQLGDLSTSRAAYKQYQSLYSDFQTLYNLGLIALRERQFLTAEGYFREALRYKPTLWEAAEALALVAEETGRPEEARRYRQQSVVLRNH
jgi:O-antigen ligase